MALVLLALLRVSVSVGMTVVLVRVLIFVGTIRFDHI